MKTTSADGVSAGAATVTSEGEPVDEPSGDPPTDAPAAPRSSGGAAPRRRDARDVARLLVRWVLVAVCAIAVYSAFLLAKGASPTEVLQSMWESAFADPDSFGETLLRTTPLLLAALAVAVPARAGLFNIGGEGQLVMGAIAAAGAAKAIGPDQGLAVSMTVMALAGMCGGMLWAAVPAALRLLTSTNEAIVSLLLNYVAAIFLAYLVFDPWKDPTSTGQAYSESLEGSQLLPIAWGDRVHVGVFVALGSAVAIWLLFRSTRWGFKLEVLGGNPEAARRAGLAAVGGLAFSAMLVGGALAGLGGMIHLSGVEERLRPDLMVGFGYVGFLASWLARHNPLKCILAALLLGAIAVGGNGLKITAGLSGAAVNILMAVVLLAVLGWGREREEAA